MGQSSSQSSEGGIIGFLRDAGTRETIESILVAVMLALLFKAFEAEAFVIPTGSMAPTLQGRHKDVACPQCQYRYRASASWENDENRDKGRVVSTVCPFCRFERPIDEAKDANDDSFSGDRILVSKFAYDLSDPRRWDVVVFRYPGNAKQPFIKRLTGLPGEEVLIENGDIHTRPHASDEAEEAPISIAPFQIARKEPRKLLAMLQTVDDTRYLAPALEKAGWPSRWQAWNQPAETSGWTRQYNAGTGPTFTGRGGPEPIYLRYRHLIPRSEEWQAIEKGQLPARIATAKGEAISDFYEYNAASVVALPGSRIRVGREVMRSGTNPGWQGLHWVGDLALEAELVLSGEGSLLLDLVEGGVHFTCEINLASGEATLTTSSNQVSFTNPQGEPLETRKLVGRTAMRAGRHHVRFANVDDALTLWIDEQVISFDGPGTYARSGPVLPTWTETDPGDAEPLGVAVQNASVEISRLRVLRDVYYVSVDSTPGEVPNDYRIGGQGYGVIREILEDPAQWGNDDALELFERRKRDFRDTYPLAAGQFFLMGDNSPQSSDARMWSQNFVRRDDLIGKALFVYYPHPWNRPIPYLPNFGRMGFIR